VDILVEGLMPISTRPVPGCSTRLKVLDRTLEPLYKAEQRWAYLQAVKAESDAESEKQKVRL